MHILPRRLSRLSIGSRGPVFNSIHPFKRANITMSNTSKNLTLLTAGGRIKCQRCLARSKRTKKQCGAPAIKGKGVCRVHGGKSTGPKTLDGLSRCAEVKTIHGRETRAIRSERSQRSAQLHWLLELGNAAGVFNTKTSLKGRKPRAR